MNLHIVGENSGTGSPPEQPEGQKLCPYMSKIVPNLNSVTQEIVPEMIQVSCAERRCAMWQDGECSEVATARALNMLAINSEFILQNMQEG